MSKDNTRLGFNDDDSVQDNASGDIDPSLVDIGSCLPYYIAGYRIWCLVLYSLWFRVMHTLGSKILGLKILRFLESVWYDTFLCTYT